MPSVADQEIMDEIDALFDGALRGLDDADEAGVLEWSGLFDFRLTVADDPSATRHESYTLEELQRLFPANAWFLGMAADAVAEGQPFTADVTYGLTRVQIRLLYAIAPVVPHCGPEPMPEPPYPPAPALRECGHVPQDGVNVDEAAMVAYMVASFGIEPTDCVTCATEAMEALCVASVAC